MRGLLDPIGEHVEVHRYERKTPLVLSKEALKQLDNVQVRYELGVVSGASSY